MKLTIKLDNLSLNGILFLLFSEFSSKKVGSSSLEVVGCGLVLEEYAIRKFSRTGRPKRRTGLRAKVLAMQMNM